jgi:hypothetical protein
MGERPVLLVRDGMPQTRTLHNSTRGTRSAGGSRSSSSTRSSASSPRHRERPPPRAPPPIRSGAGARRTARGSLRWQAPLAATLRSTDKKKDRTVPGDTIALAFSQLPRAADDVEISIQQGQFQENGDIIPGAVLASFRGRGRDGSALRRDGSALRRDQQRASRDRARDPFDDGRAVSRLDATQ